MINVIYVKFDAIGSAKEVCKVQKIRQFLMLKINLLQGV